MSLRHISCNGLLAIGDSLKSLANSNQQNLKDDQFQCYEDRRKKIIEERLTQAHSGQPNVLVSGHLTSE